MNELVEFLQARITEDPAAESELNDLIVEYDRLMRDNPNHVFPAPIPSFAKRYRDHPDFKPEWVI
ncbi:hypothetical protein ATK74_1769 [Propionicimonas paludicola]|uniref:Uncharacterized protein n=1 Tax=Propionicimonas paludicola TaxID=185243 RepID=A0A2A9CSV2_9ACTN|nr:hypothetical protein [Propionicimonas paludicola]PFG17206.1 hypothetical protein ATK74_1769 [Propionicimonas paludicola]